MNSRGTSIYMSSTTLPKAIQYLTKLQAQSGQPSARVFEDAVASMLSHPEEQWEDIARRAGLVFTEDLRRQVHHLKESRLLDVMRRGVRDTPALQSVNDYAIMRETKESFDKLIRSRFSQPERYAVSDKVFFGTLESATVNAMITTVPDSDEFLVLINRALWDLAKLLPFTLATTLFSEQFTFRPYDPACDYPNSSLSSEIVAAIMTRVVTSSKCLLFRRGIIPSLSYTSLCTGAFMTSSSVMSTATSCEGILSGIAERKPTALATCLLP